MTVTGTPTVGVQMRSTHVGLLSKYERPGTGRVLLKDGKHIDDTRGVSSHEAKNLGFMIMMGGRTDLFLVFCWKHFWETYNISSPSSDALGHLMIVAVQRVNNCKTLRAGASPKTAQTWGASRVFSAVFWGWMFNFQDVCQYASCPTAPSNHNHQESKDWHFWFKTRDPNVPIAFQCRNPRQLPFAAYKANPQTELWYLDPGWSRLEGFVLESQLQRPEALNQISFALIWQWLEMAGWLAGWHWPAWQEKIPLVNVYIAMENHLLEKLNQLLMSLFQ
jgi:hypothetical protein